MRIFSREETRPRAQATVVVETQRFHNQGMTECYLPAIARARYFLFSRMGQWCVPPLVETAGLRKNNESENVTVALLTY